MGYFGKYFGAVAASESGGELDLTTPVAGETFPEGSLGALLQKLDVGEPEDPVIPIPIPASATARAVYGGVKLPSGQYAVGQKIRFDRLSLGLNGGWAVTSAPQTATVDAAGHLGIALEMGTYRVVCGALKLTTQLLEVGEADVDFGAWLDALPCR